MYLGEKHGIFTEVKDLWVDALRGLAVLIRCSATLCAGFMPVILLTLSVFAIIRRNIATPMFYLAAVYLYYSMQSRLIRTWIR